VADLLQPGGAAEVLQLWERVQGLPPHRQAAEMLAAAEPAQTPASIAELSIGARDARLLTLREQLFGPQMKSLADCPNCGERVEMGFQVDHIRTATAASAEQESASGSMLLIEGGWCIEYRLPTGADLAEIPDGSNPQAARRYLLHRCVLAVDSDPDNEGVEGSATAPEIEQLPANLVERIVEAMSEADPQADVELLLSCPACGHQWQAPFDIVSYLVTEVDVWARRILADVARLARGYGWCETDILAMTPARRQAYLELLENL
jgi:hypothetical protein